MSVVEFAEQVLKMQQTIERLERENDRFKRENAERAVREKILREDSILCKEEGVFPFAHSDDDDCPVDQTTGHQVHGPNTHGCTLPAGHPGPSHSLSGFTYRMEDELVFLRKFYREHRHE